jgi:hypothetical protein
MQSLNNGFTVIIRSVEERTEGICFNLIKSQLVDEDNITIINRKPFSLALRQSFEVGMIKNKQWTLCVDADLFLRPGSISHLIQLTSSVDMSICEIQGYILDKFFGGPRIGGVHLYRTNHLEKALKCIPEDESEVRPESRTLIKMKELGYPSIIFPYVVGLHDFEQYYKDIFRKCFIQARKHQMFLDLFVPYWQIKAKQDKDFDVALKGLAKGIEYLGDIGIDANNNIIQEYFIKYKVKEKSQLLKDSLNLNDVENIYETWQEPEEYKKKFPDEMGLGNYLQNKKEKKVFFGSSKFGVIRSINFYLGAVLFRFGDSLRKKASTLMNQNSNK